MNPNSTIPPRSKRVESFTNHHHPRHAESGTQVLTPRLVTCNTPQPYGKSRRTTFFPHSSIFHHLHPHSPAPPSLPPKNGVLVLPQPLAQARASPASSSPPPASPPTPSANPIPHRTPDPPIPRPAHRLPLPPPLAAPHTTLRPSQNPKSPVLSAQQRSAIAPDVDCAGRARGVAVGEFIGCGVRGGGGGGGGRGVGCE